MSALRKTSEGVTLNAFYKLFCTMDSLCSNGEPNLLGWLVILAVGVFLVFLVF